MRRRVGISVLVAGFACLAVTTTGAQPSQGQNESLRELAAAREELALHALERIEVWRRSGGHKVDEAELLDWWRRLMDAQCDLAENDKERATAIQAYVDRLSSRLELYRTLERAGRLGSTNDPELVEYYLLEVKEQLIRSQMKPEYR